MTILGIDPGIASVGYGVVSVEKNRMLPLEYGTFTTPANYSVSTRLSMIFEFVSELCKKHSVDALAIEELFFNTNSKTVINVAQARGVILLSATLNGLATYEYTPLQVKQAVVGYGRADKKQVQYMVKELLRLEKPPRPDDTADALAIAICHANSCTSKIFAHMQNGGTN